MPEVNPEILTWARETAGLTREDAVARLGFSDARRRTALERLDDLNPDGMNPAAAYCSVWRVSTAGRCSHST